MQFKHFIIIGGLATVLSTSQHLLVHADVNHNVLRQHLSSSQLTYGLDHAIHNQCWQVNHLNGYELYLLHHPYTYYGTTGNSDNRNVPWEGNHTIARNSNGDVTYYLNPNNSGEINQIATDAINNWDALGVFHFVPVDDWHDASIIIDDDQDYQSVASNFGIQPDFSDGDWTGVTFYTLTPNQNNCLTILREDPYHDNTYTYDTKVSMVEHEIGHALGFDHDMYEKEDYQVKYQYFYNRHTHQFTKSTLITVNHHDQVVMNPTVPQDNDDNQVIQLGQAEVQALHQHYGV